MCICVCVFFVFFETPNIFLSFFIFLAQYKFACKSSKSPYGRKVKTWKREEREPGEREARQKRDNSVNCGQCIRQCIAHALRSNQFHCGNLKFFQILSLKVDINGYWVWSVNSLYKYTDTDYFLPFDTNIDILPIPTLFYKLFIKRILIIPILFTFMSLWGGGSLPYITLVHVLKLVVDRQTYGPTEPTDQHVHI